MEISKILSRNDTGESGGHQDGFLVPKTVVNFFPDLDIYKKNPRMEIIFKDISFHEWVFNFIYYNNKKFDGTRDEYRLTRTARYIKTYSLQVGDTVTLSRKDNKYFISHDQTHEKITVKKIVLSHKWKVIKI